MIGNAAILDAGILIVDDQEANVQLLEQMLRGVGYTRITSTRFPKEVWDLHKENRYDLILLDLVMSDMDGFEVMEGLKDLEIDGYLPILAITVEPSHKLRALQSGARDFVSKPFELAEVLARVHNMLEVRLLHKEARMYSKTLESLALNDPLTGLANRRLLTDRLQMAFVHARRTQVPTGIIYLDLDGFKQVNDTLGHSCGDILLQLVAQRLIASVREEDTVARLGGDEFLLLLWQVSGIEYAARTAERAILAVSKPYTIEGHTVRISTSAGVAIYPDQGEDPTTLMKSADGALYAAKEAGKNQCRIGLVSRE